MHVLEILVGSEDSAPKLDDVPMQMEFDGFPEVRINELNHDTAELRYCRCICTMRSTMSYSEGISCNQDRARHAWLRGNGHCGVAHVTQTNKQKDQHTFNKKAANKHTTTVEFFVQCRA